MFASILAAFVSIGGRVARVWGNLTPLGRRAVVKWSLFGVWVVVLGGWAWRMKRDRDASRAELRAATLELANSSALLDSLHRSRLTAADSAALMLGDSVDVLERLVVQRTQQRDALDKALGLERTATVDLRAHVRTLETSTRSTDTVRVTDAGDRRASFDVRETPYTAHADVTLPASGRGSIDLSVRLDTARIRARLGCSTSATNGVRTATLALEAPRWLELEAPAVEQDAAVCGSAAPTTRDVGRRRRWLPRVGVGYGYVVSVDSGAIRARRGPFAGIVWTWP